MKKYHDFVAPWKCPSGRPIAAGWSMEPCRAGPQSRTVELGYELWKLDQAGHNIYTFCE